jgi:hypothetical protein
MMSITIPVIEIKSACVNPDIYVSPVEVCTAFLIRNIPAAITLVNPNPLNIRVRFCMVFARCWEYGNPEFSPISTSAATTASTRIPKAISIIPNTISAIIVYGIAPAVISGHLSDNSNNAGKI